MSGLENSIECGLCRCACRRAARPAPPAPTVLWTGRTKADFVETKPVRCQTPVSTTSSQSWPCSSSPSSPSPSTGAPSAPRSSTWQISCIKIFNKLSILGLQELYENFYYIWAKLKNGDAECKDVEWKRRMHFVLDQLKSGKTLTTR